MNENDSGWDSEEERMDEMAEKIEELEERIEDTQEGRTEVEIQSHDIRIRMKSESDSAEKLAELAHEEAEFLTTQALKGHMVEIEERGLSLFNLGD